MNRSSIRARIRVLTLMETDDISNDDLNNIINEGVDAVGGRFEWPFLAAMDSFGVTAATQGYAFTSIASNVVGQIAAVVRTGKHRISEISPQDALAQYGDDFGEGSDATHYFVWGTSVYLVPTPDTTEAAAYKLYYFRRPTTLDNDVDEPEWERQFHELLVSYGCSKVWEREEDMEKAKYWSDKFDQSVEAMARFYLNRADDHPVIVGESASFSTSGNMPWLNGV